MKNEQNTQNQFCIVYWLSYMSAGFQFYYVTNYFVRITNNENILMLFNAIAYVIMPFAMLAAQKISAKYNVFFVFRLSVLLHCGVFLIIFLFPYQLLYFEAVIFSIAMAFYNISFTALITHVSSDHDRDHLYGKALIGANLILLVLPVPAGYLFNRFTSLKGYYLVGAFSLIMGIFCLLYCKKLSFPTDKDTQAPDKICWWKIIRNNKQVVNALVLCVLRSIRDGSFIFIVNIMLFSIVKNETLIGLNTSLCGIASVLGSVLYSRFVTVDTRRKSLFLSLNVLAFFAFVLVLKQSIPIILSFSVLNALLSNFNILTTTNFELGVVKDMETEFGIPTSKIIAMREFVVSFGRLLGTGFVFCLSHNLKTITVAVLIIVMIQYLSLLFMPKQKCNFLQSK